MSNTKARVSWLDGTLTTAPKVIATNRGFLTGIGVFETLKVSDSHPEFLDRHMNRLAEACQRLGLPLNNSNALNETVAEVISANKDIAGSARLRVTVTAQSDSSSIFISMSELAPWPETTSCVVAPWIRNERSPLSGVKSTSYAENVLALNWAQELGYSEAILFDSVGKLAEGTTTNIFIVKNGEVLTPSRASGLLPGVVRQVILDENLAKEAELTSEDLESADEVFLTSSTRGVHPVDRLNDRHLRGGGEFTNRIVKSFESLKK
jgi:branched-chain amino acid aminotransferase